MQRRLLVALSDQLTLLRLGFPMLYSSINCGLFLDTISESTSQVLYKSLNEPQMTSSRINRGEGSCSERVSTKLRMV